MNKEEIKNVNLSLYSKTLNNGLRVFIVPKSDSNNCYVTLSTNYGSSINEFIPLNSKDFIRVPNGVAHFLEHKLFEQKDGIDPFTFFTKNGCDANANTSNAKTTYLFSGPTNIEENINYLLDFVQEPYFTDKNVEKEKGIIEQEIKMYDDIPFWKLFDKTIYNVFINHPLKYPIAGTVDSINKITKETLYDCYNTFYNPSNMFLTITGNVNSDKLIKIIEENQSKKSFKIIDKINIKEIDEPDIVEKTNELINLNIEIPKIALAYKINIKDFDINSLNLYLNTIFDIKLGSTSVFFEKLKKENLVTENIEYEVILTKKHIVYCIFAETKEPELVSNLIDLEIQDLTVSEEELNRKKKVLKSIVQFRSDSIYAINSKINNNIIKFNKVITNDYEIIDNMNINEIKKIAELIDLSNKTLSIMKSA